VSTNRRALWSWALDKREVEGQSAATLMLRGLTFWLPMLPGVWLARREVGGRT